MLNTTLAIEKLLLIIIALVIYYHYIKLALFKLAAYLTKLFSKSSHYSIMEINGTIELILAALSHLIFCGLLAYLLDIAIVPYFLSVRLIDCMLAVFIGIGCVGIAIGLCSAVIALMETLIIGNTLSNSEWGAIAGAGWIKHHKHCLKLTPFYLALVIICMQIGAEETVFRGILIPYFNQDSVIISVIISTALFILMQAFHMPSLLSALFPMIGATVMGIVHGILFINNPSIIPLIIAHLSFFIFTLIKMEP